MSGASPLSEIDASFLYRYGRDLTEDVVGLVTETTLVTIYGVLFALAMYSFHRRGFKSRVSFVMLFLVVYLYLAAVVLWGLYIAQYLMNVHDLLMTSNIPLPDRFVLADAHASSLSIPQMVLFTSNMILGDFIVIWRVWAIYHRTRQVVVLPCITLAAALAFALVDTVCLRRSGVGSDACGNSSLISWAFSLATNVLCTILIGVKAWKHRQITRELQTEGTAHKYRGTGFILSVLVESGLIYCLLWATQLVQIFNISRTSALVYFWEITNAASEQLPGMYPTLIVVVVNLRYTIDWEDESSSIARNPNYSTLRWAHSSDQATHPQRTHSERSDSAFDVRGVPLKMLAATALGQEEEDETSGDLESSESATQG
ncbi:hypothetical protein MSAN_01030000 [Mycena sanguinolenta]|uniref:Uncharacterized protein n=1 Tax=Mycena sanguinolenta TaxID=230812 RepID=A0A8H6YRA1_9AGAR|nr:hypothetical protein MSAN_01030000 [Mycena sanguinolenta]